MQEYSWPALICIAWSPIHVFFQPYQQSAQIRCCYFAYYHYCCCCCCLSLVLVFSSILIIYVNVYQVFKYYMSNHNMSNKISKKNMLVFKRVLLKNLLSNQSYLLRHVSWHAFLDKYWHEHDQALTSTADGIECPHHH